jgi:hypothetical protein
VRSAMQAGAIGYLVKGRAGRRHPSGPRRQAYSGRRGGGRAG